MILLESFRSCLPADLQQADNIRLGARLLEQASHDFGSGQAPGKLSHSDRLGLERFVRQVASAELENLIA